MKRYIIVSYLFTCLQIVIQAQSLQNSYRIISKADGLPSLLNIKVFETSDGYLWLATQNGLARFDGRQFKMFYSFYADSNSITGNMVTDLEEDPYHRLWISSFNKGLAIYDLKTGSWLQYQHPTIDENPTYRILDLHRDKDDNMWIGTMGRGLLKYDYGQRKFIQYLLNKALTSNGNNPDHNTVRKIADDPYDKNILWLACMDGLYRFDKKTEQLSQFENIRNGKKSWKDNCFHAILTPPGNIIWLGTWGGGMVSFNKETGSFASYPYNTREYSVDDMTTNIVFDLYPEGDSSLYVATNDQGLLGWNKKTHHFYSVISPGLQTLGERNRCIMGISSTSGNCIWICGQNNIYLLNKIYSRFGNYQSIHQDPEPGYLPFAELNDATWVSQKNSYWLACISKDGILEYDSNFHFASYIPVAGRKSKLTSYRCIKKDRNGVIWIQSRTAPYFYFFDTKNREFEPVTNFVPGKDPDGPVSRFVIDKRNYLWTVTDSFLVQYNIASHEAKKIMFIPDTASHLKLPLTAARITLGNDDKVWIGSNIGLWSFDLVSAQWQHIYPEIKKGTIRLADPDIGSIAVDRNGKIWIGPASQGIQVYDPAQKKIERGFHVSSDPSFHSSGVPWIQSAPDGNIWACTYNGLAVWERDKEQWEWFYQRDGLVKDYADQPLIIFPNGKALLAQYEGFIAFDTKHWQRNDFTPRLKITGIDIDDASLTVNDSTLKRVKIKASEKRILFSFAAIEPLFPERLQYWYRLKGYDDQWRITAQTQIQFGALPPGNYTFFIKAQNSDGKWSRLLEIPVEVLAPFWKKWWFIPSVMGLIIVLIYIVYSYRLSQVIKLRQIRDDISRDLHDEIGSSVSSINMLSTVAKKHIESNHPVSGLLNQIGQSAQQAGESIDEIVWSINPRYDAAYATFNRLRSEVSNLFESVGIDYSIELPDVPENGRLDAKLRQDIWLICKEAINNIIKYSACKKASLQIKWEKDVLHIRIADDGKGFNMEEAVKKGHNGLKNMQLRTEKYKNGHFEMHSNNGKGSVILCRLPAKGSAGTKM